MVSYVGTWMQRIAQDWLILVITGSAGALGITTGLQFLPTLLLSPMAGVVADRYAKRRILACTSLVQGAAAVALGTLAITGVIHAWHVYALTLVFGAAGAFEVPARQAYIAEITTPGTFVNAMGLHSVIFNSARMVGPAIAGGLISLLGSGPRASGWVIVLNGASFGVVVVSLWLMRESEMMPSTRLTHSRHQLAEGLRYVRSRPDILLVLVVAFFIGTFGLNFGMTIALMATRVYHRGAGQYGLLGSIFAIGSLTGAFGAARRTLVRQRLIVVSGIVFGLVEVVAGLMPSYTTFALALALCGATGMTVTTSTNAYVQTAVGAEMRGRFMAVYMMSLMGGTTVGAPLLGWIADRFGARWTLVGGGLVTAAGPVVAVAAFGRRQGVGVGGLTER